MKNSELSWSRLDTADERIDELEYSERTYSRMKLVEAGESMKHTVRRSDRRFIPEFKERREGAQTTREHLQAEICNLWFEEVQQSPRKTRERKSRVRLVNCKTAKCKNKGNSSK